MTNENGITGVDWTEEDQTQSKQPQQTQQRQNQNPQGGMGMSNLQNGLAELFSSVSMTADNRSLKEVTEVQNELKDYYKEFSSSTTNDIQRKLIPTVETLTTAISPHLPGVALHIEAGNVFYVGCALFSNNNLTPVYENVNINNHGVTQQMSVQRTPSQYADQALMARLRDHYSQVAKARNIPNVALISVSVIDLEMLNHPEMADGKIRSIAHSLAKTWEEAITVKLLQEAAVNNAQLPSLWRNSKAPFGPNGIAEARVTAVSGRLNRDNTLSPANMEVTTTVLNPRNNNNLTDTIQEIARVTATVELCAVSLNSHNEYVATQGHRQGNFGFVPGVYPNGYKPLRPVITINEVSPGEMLNFYSGLPAFFFGLYTLMATNNQYIFCEALRRNTVGARGNLSDLEIRINQMLNGVTVPGRIELNSKTIADTDLVNQWIAQNVSQRATFQVNLLTGGGNNAVTNFLLGLARKNNGQQVKTVLAVLNSMTNGKFGAIVAENRANNTGWKVEDPILIPTANLEVNGIAHHADKVFNTLELGEMMLCHLKGKNNIAGIESFLSTKYGINPEEDNRARSQRLRIELAQSLFDNHVHINGFAQTHVWNPEFMATLGKAFDSIGNLNVANSNLSVRSNVAAYSLNAGLATSAHAGGNNINNQVNVGMGQTALFM